MISVGIAGRTGCTRVEPLRILCRHPGVELTAITSLGEAGTAVADLFPSLSGRIDQRFRDPADAGLDQVLLSP